MYPLELKMIATALVHSHVDAPPFHPFHQDLKCILSTPETISYTGMAHAGCYPIALLFPSPMRYQTLASPSLSGGPSLFSFFLLLSTFTPLIVFSFPFMPTLTSLLQQCSCQILRRIGSSGQYLLSL